MSTYERITFTAEIPLDDDEITAGDGSLAQAIQNVIGHTGAVVLSVEQPELPLADRFYRTPDMSDEGRCPCNAPQSKCEGCAR